MFVMVIRYCKFIKKVDKRGLYIAAKGPTVKVNSEFQNLNANYPF